MVKLKFIIRDNALVLRISEGRERYYKRVKSLFTGEPNLKHWNEKKEAFDNYSDLYKHCNKVLAEYKEMFWQVVTKHPELSAKQVSNYHRHVTEQHASKPVELGSWDVSEYRNSIEKFLEVVVVREKAKRGCNFECYYKLLLRCRRDIPNFQHAAFTTIDYNWMVSIACIFAENPGYKHMTKTFRAMLGKAHRDNDVMFNISQIGDFRFNDYSPQKYDTDKKPDVLSQEQVRAFMSSTPKELTPTYRNKENILLYYDFCVFMFNTFLAPCDAIKAKHKDITRRHTLLVRRKKTGRAVEVPITPAIENIIKRYNGKSPEGYIFPIMDTQKETKYKTKDYTYKRFRERLNSWLKKVGESLELDYDLYAYVFRHTAITCALDNGLPLNYVSNVAGTSVEMIQQHYYNGDNQQNNSHLINVFSKLSRSY